MMTDAPSVTDLIVSRVRARWGAAIVAVLVSGDLVQVKLFALFDVYLRAAAEPGAFTARLIGWDRDLSGYLTRATSDDLDALLSDIDRTIHELASDEALAPTAHTAPARSLASAGAALTWQERRQAALDARTLRSHGVDPLDHIDEKALGERIQAWWPDAPVLRVPEYGGVTYSLRPTDTFRVEVRLGRHGGVTGWIATGGGLDGAFGRSFGADGQPRRVEEALATIDSWLRATMPRPDVLNLPVLPERERAS